MSDVLDGRYCPRFQRLPVHDRGIELSHAVRVHNRAAPGVKGSVLFEGAQRRFDRIDGRSTPFENRITLGEGSRQTSAHGGFVLSAQLTWSGIVDSAVDNQNRIYGRRPLRGERQGEKQHGYGKTKVPPSEKRADHGRMQLLRGC
jgi:hypothetical protein